MKTFKEFAKQYNPLKQISKLDSNSFNEVVKSHYEKYKNYYFNIWLSKIDADTINKVGVKNFREIWEVMDCCDK